MDESGPERMKDYERERSSVDIPVTHISGAGRFSVPGLGDGRVAGVGHISPEEVRISGTGTLPGGLNVGRVNTSGSANFKGDLMAETMKVSGTTTVQGSLNFGSLRSSGSLRVGGTARGCSMNASGLTKIEEGIELEDELVSSGSLIVDGDVSSKNTIDIDGVVEIRGKISTGLFEAYLNRGGSHVDGGIEAETVDIRRGGKYRVPLLPRIFRWEDREGDMRTTDVRGSREVLIENVACENVIGGRVVIGEGCEVSGKVIYTETVKVHEGAKVKNPPEKMEPPGS